MSRDLRQKLIASIVILAIPVAVAGLYFALRDRLPAEIYDSYSWGPFSERESLSSFGWVSSLGWAMIAIVVLFAARSEGSRRVVFWIWFMAAFGACNYAKSLIMGWLAPDATPELWHQMVATLPLVPIGIWLRRSMPRPDVCPPPLPVSPFRFDTDVKVVWTGSAFVPKRLYWLLSTLGAGAFIAIWLPAYGMIPVIFGLLNFTDFGTRVLINDRGVRLSTWPITRPRRDVSLDLIAACSVVWVNTNSAGEYQLAGLDGAVATWSLVIGSDKQLVLSLTNGTHIPVSVDDAQEAADVINALIARERGRTTLASDARQP